MPPCLAECSSNSHSRSQNLAPADATPAQIGHQALSKRAFSEFLQACRGGRLWQPRRWHKPSACVTVAIQPTRRAVDSIRLALDVMAQVYCLLHESQGR